jgi:hypothetical protein
VLAITPVMTGSEINGLLPRPTGWTDSVVLNRSWSFRVHAPRMERSVDRTESSPCNPR